MPENKYTFHIVGSDQTKAMFASINASIRKSVNLVGTFGAGMAAGLSVMVARSVDASTEMSRLAQSVGVSTESMSEWSHAAKTVNLEGDKMADIFKDVQDKIGDFAATGGGGAADMFKRLNLNVREFVGLAPDQQLIKIGEALDGVQSRSEKIFFLEALAGDASRLLPLLEDGAEGLRALQAEAEALGVSITDVDAAKLEAAGRSMERMQAVATGFGNKVAVEVAPVLEVMVEHLVGAATEGDRLGEVIKQGFSVGAKAVGVFADGVRGVQVVVKGAEVVLRGLTAVGIAGLGRLASFMNEGLRNAIIDGFFWPLQSALDLLGKLSPLAREVAADVEALVTDIKTSAGTGFQVIVDQNFAAFDQAKSELDTLLMSEMPSEVIAQNVDRIFAEATVRAKARAAELRAEIPAIASPAAADAPGEDPLEKERARLAQRLQMIDASHLTELQRLQVKFANELQIIQQAEDQKLITEQSAQAKRLRATKAFEEGKVKLTEAGANTQASLVQGNLDTIAGFVNSGSKRLFAVQKAAALAQAAVSVPAAVVESYKNAGGYPWGIVPAAIMAAKGAAQIASIKKQSIGGSGSIASATGGGAGSTGSGGTTPAAPTLGPTIGSQFNHGQSAERATTSVHFHIAGDVNGDTAETMLERMATLIKERDVVLFAPDSRQALDLAGR